MESDLIVIGKINNEFEWQFIYMNKSDIPICVFKNCENEKNIEKNEIRQYLILIYEILLFYEYINESINEYDQLIINIKNIFVSDCINNWIEDWKKDDFYYYNNNNKYERPNRDLLLKISKLKDKMNIKINIMFNYNI